MPVEPLWTVAQVAEYLAVTERTVRAWQTDRRLPFLKLGGVVRFRPFDIQSWAEQFDEPDRPVVALPPEAGRSAPATAARVRVEISPRASAR